MSLSPDLKQRVFASLAEMPAPTRAQVRRARVWLFGCGVVVSGILFEHAGAPSDRSVSIIIYPYGPAVDYRHREHSARSILARRQIGVRPLGQLG